MRRPTKPGRKSLPNRLKRSTSNPGRSGMVSPSRDAAILYFPTKLTDHERRHRIRARRDAALWGGGFRIQARRCGRGRAAPVSDGADLVLLLVCDPVRTFLGC